jgi:ABC-type arginine/histidine transport system permease subunit
VFSFLEILKLIATAFAALLVKLLNHAGYSQRIFFGAWSSDWRGAIEMAGCALPFGAL